MMTLRDVLNSNAVWLADIIYIIDKDGMDVDSASLDSLVKEVHTWGEGVEIQLA